MPQGQAGTEVWAFWRTTGAREIIKKTSTYDATAANVIAEKMRWRMSIPAYTQIPSNRFGVILLPRFVYRSSAMFLPTYPLIHSSTHSLILSFIPQPSPLPTPFPSLRPLKWIPRILQTPLPTQQDTQPSMQNSLIPSPHMEPVARILNSTTSQGA